MYNTVRFLYNKPLNVWSIVGGIHNTLLHVHVTRNISGALEFSERRSNLISQSDRPLVMQARLVADSATDGDL